MTTSNRRWAVSIFKGRMGEAIVESVLSEFGYTVRRAGFEQISSDGNRLSPDLLVTHPRTKAQCYVEVKYRSARPTTVQYDPDRIRVLGLEYPGTVLAFVSAYDGAIYCSTIEDLPVASGGSISLIDGLWKPLWHFFDLVHPGGRLKDLWSQLQATMETYGTRTILGRRDRRLWEDEYHALDRYLEERWEDSLQELGIPKPDPEKLTLEERWERVRQIGAAQLALDLFAEDEIFTPTLQLAFQRALGRKGEEHLLVDIPELAKSLGVGVEDAVGIMVLISSLIKSSSNRELEGLRQRLIEEIPDGIGEVFLLDAALSFEEAQKVDLKTAIRLASNPCRLDR